MASAAETVSLASLPHESLSFLGPCSNIQVLRVSEDEMVFLAFPDSVPGQDLRSSDASQYAFDFFTGSKKGSQTSPTNRSVGGYSKGSADGALGSSFLESWGFNDAAQDDCSKGTLPFPRVDCLQLSAQNLKASLSSGRACPPPSNLRCRDIQSYGEDERRRRSTGAIVDLPTPSYFLRQDLSAKRCNSSDGTVPAFQTLSAEKSLRLELDLLSTTLPFSQRALEQKASRISCKDDMHSASQRLVMDPPGHLSVCRGKQVGSESEALAAPRAEGSEEEETPLLQCPPPLKPQKSILRWRSSFVAGVKVVRKGARMKTVRWRDSHGHGLYCVREFDRSDPIDNIVAEEEDEGLCAGCCTVS